MNGAPIRVVFVCVENSNRSQMAEAFARMHFAGKVEAYSAGSKPSGVVNSKAIQSMKERGYDLTTHASKGLTALPDLTFDAAISMGCGDECPLVRTKLRQDWSIPDPKHLPSDEFRQVRDGIESRVVALLTRLIGAPGD